MSTQAQMTMTRSEFGTASMALYLHVFDKYSAKEIAFLSGLPEERIERFLRRRDGSDWHEFVARAEGTQSLKDVREELEAFEAAQKAAEEEAVLVDEDLINRAKELTKDVVVVDDDKVNYGTGSKALNAVYEDPANQGGGEDSILMPAPFAELTYEATGTLAEE
jgi:hypothetical protein